MELLEFGRTGLRVSPLGFGSAEIGFDATGNETVAELLNTALDNGLNVIDTAECYADAEGAIGRAIAGRRDDYHLFTKCGHASGLEGPDWNPKMLALSIDRSLERLRTDHVELVQLHSCDRELLRQGDVIDVLRRAREAGKTRFIGYSGDREDALYAVECGAFDSLQTSVSIADQEAIDLTLPKARERGMGVIAKRPVANVAWKSEPAPGGYTTDYWNRLQKLSYPFLRDRLDDAVGKALRFTLAQRVDVAIVGTTRPERWTTNLGYALQGPLSEDEVGEIRRRWAEVAGPDWVGLT